MAEPDPEKGKYSAELQQEVSQTAKLSKLVGVIAIVATVASIATLCVRLLPKGYAEPLDVPEVDIEITKHKGVTANLNAVVKLKNHMPGIMHDDNSVETEDGKAARINGAYIKNAESEGGGADKIIGWYGNNAVSKDGDVNTEESSKTDYAVGGQNVYSKDGDVSMQDGVYSGLGKLSSGVVTAGSKFTASNQSLQSAASRARLVNVLKAGVLPPGQLGEVMTRDLLDIAGKSDNSSGSYSLKDLAADYYGVKQANPEQREHVKEKLLRVLYGPKLTSHDSADMANAISTFKQAASNKSLVAAQMKQETFHSTVLMIGKDNIPILNKSSITIANSTNPEKDGTLAEIINYDLGQVANTAQGPLRIEKLKLKVEDQAGIQANLAAGVKFENDMPKSLHNNGNAKSLHGEAMRVNGVYANNAIGQGKVMRVNGVFDSNAISKGNGTVTQVA